MNFKEFQKQVMKGLKERQPKLRIQPARIVKNNDIVRRGVSISEEGSNIAPTLYLEELFQEYKDGRPLQSIVGQVLLSYEKSRVQESIRMDFFLEYKQVRSRIVYRLVNYHKNKTRLQTIPHIRFLDMAVIFACTLLNDGIGNASIVVSREHMHMWQVDTQELLAAAVENTPRYHRLSLRDMAEVLQDLLQEQAGTEVTEGNNVEEPFCGEPDAGEWRRLMQEELEEELLGESRDCPLYVMGSHDKQFGAGTILYPNALADFAKEMGQNLFILPCSVHEVILVPDSGREDPLQLQQMVAEVNRTQLDAEDILSDSVYYYDRETENLTLACEG